MGWTATAGRIGVAGLAACASTADGQHPPPPRAGDYQCVTFSLSVRAMQEFRTNLATGRQGFEFGVGSSVEVTPAPFGLRLDGRGRYTAPGTTGTGIYTYNRSTSQIAFAGDISMLTPRKYFVTNWVYGLVFETRDGFFWQCENRDGAQRTNNGETVLGGNAGGSGARGTAALNGGLRGQIYTQAAELRDGYIARVAATDLATGAERVVFDDGLVAATASGVIFHVNVRSQMELTNTRGDRTALIQEGGRYGLGDLHPVISLDGQRIALLPHIAQRTSDRWRV